MNTDAQSKTKVSMQRRDFRCMNKVKPGTTLLCNTGVLWVTQNGDRKDYILLPGNAFTVTNRGKVLVEAMRDADFQVV